MMPLLRNITKDNVIPIIDFEDQTQADLNYLLLHVYDCLPSVALKYSDTALARIPSDLNMEVSILDTNLDVSKVTVEDIKKALKHKVKKSSPMKEGC